MSCYVTAERGIRAAGSLLRGGSRVAEILSYGLEGEAL